MIGNVINGYGNNNYNNTYNAYNRLASGSRINRAADDPAGMAISNKLESEIRSQAVQQRNTADQVSQYNIRDGRLSGVINSLQDIRANAVYAANGTLSSDDRSAVLNNSTQLMQDMTQQIGADEMSRLGLSNLDLTDMDAIDQAIQSVSSEASGVGAMTNASEHMMNVNAIMRENLMASQSRIADTDYGEEVTNLRTQETMDAYRVQLQKDQIEQSQKNSVLNMMV